MSTPQTAIGKGTVGEPAPAPAGKECLEFKLSLFFDGTMNNRSNTNVRIASAAPVAVQPCLPAPTPSGARS